MYKFFIEANQIQENVVRIIGEDVNHISNVLRLKLNDNIIICNKNTCKSYMAEIDGFTKEQIECKIVNEIEESTESNVNIYLFQGLPKADKMENIIQKATEIGVRNIFPVQMERCIVKIDKKAESKKIERWQKIAEVAAKQSKRDWIPRIENLINIENICKSTQKYDIILIAYENENGNTLKNELKKLDRNKKLTIGVVVGPEGGITEEEVKQLESAGGKSVTLGKRILRTETAPIVLLSDIVYEFEL